MPPGGDAAETTQYDAFAASEADRYFERNRDAFVHFDAESDAPLRLLDLCHIEPSAVLEIGGANGFRVAALVARHGCTGVATELSRAAIADGEARFPSVGFVHAPSHDIPLDRTFDLVIVNFVLHWVDRSSLLRTIAEIDRLLAPGGHLLLGDFLPDRPVATKYHHLPTADLRTFKQDYARSFLVSGLYIVAAVVTGDHGGTVPAASVSSDDRVAYWLLEKLHGQAPGVATQR